MCITLAYAHSGPPSLLAESCEPFIFAFLIMLPHLDMIVLGSTKDMINYEPIYLIVKFDCKFFKGHQKSQLNSVNKIQRAARSCICVRKS